MDLTHTEAQTEWVLSMIRKAYRKFLSFRSLKMLPSFLLSPYKRELSFSFMKNLENGMRTFGRLRNLKLSGFGKFTTKND